MNRMKPMPILRMNRLACITLTLALGFTACNRAKQPAEQAAAAPEPGIVAASMD
jgi:hypothetical protein